MDYLRPASLDEARAALALPGARALAGGSDLLLRCGRDEPWPEILVDLKNIAGLRAIERDAKGIRLGALASVSELLESGLLEDWPALLTALRGFAGRQIRNRATLGGNLAHASPAADSAPPLMAYGARVATDRREMSLDELFTGPGGTVLEPDELILSLVLPRPPAGSRSFYVKLAPREAMAISVVGVAGLIVMDRGGVEKARLTLGSVAPTVIRARRAEEFLEGGVLTRERAGETGRLAAGESSPIDDIRASASYRRRMVERITAWELSRLA